jgi:biotin carboxyl carrier protein
MRITPRLITWVGVPIVILLLVSLYSAHRVEMAKEAAREAPVVAPSRVRLIGTNQAVVTLDSSDLRRIGLETAPVQRSTTGAEESIAGEVVPEPDRVAVLRAPVAGRLSLPQDATWPRFGEQVSAKGQLAQVSDARPLSLPFDGTVTRVGAQPGEVVEAGQVLLEVTDYSRPMVRLPWPGTLREQPPASIELQPVGSDERVEARLVGAAAEADPITRRPAFLYRAHHSWAGARPGTPVVGLLTTGAPRAGVVIPDRAVVQWEGLTWTYLQRGARRFARVPVPTDRPTAGGWIVGAPFIPGDTVVVTGAEQLLSEEFRARVTVGEEVGE